MSFNFSGRRLGKRGRRLGKMPGLLREVNVGGQFPLELLHNAGHLNEVTLELRHLHHYLDVSARAIANFVNRRPQINNFGFDLLTEARVKARDRLLVHGREVFDDALDLQEPRCRPLLHRDVVALNQCHCLVRVVPQLMPNLVEHLRLRGVGIDELRVVLNGHLRAVNPQCIVGCLRHEVLQGMGDLLHRHLTTRCRWHLGTDTRC